MQFNFDTFLLDAAARELRRSGDAVHLSPKAFELLRALIEARPAAISKQDLHRLLWPDTFVTDTSLATIVSELRTALGDNARRPRYIRTVHAYGYAFCGHATATHRPGALPSRYWIQYDDRRIPLSNGENLVGRSAGSTVVLDLPEVSRRHARIIVSHAGVTIEDLSSRNGTFVRDTRIAAPHPLTDGDAIAVGPVRLTFHTLFDGATTKTTAAQGVRAQSLKKT